MYLSLAPATIGRVHGVGVVYHVITSHVRHRKIRSCRRRPGAAHSVMGRAWLRWEVPVVAAATRGARRFVDPRGPYDSVITGVAHFIYSGLEERGPRFITCGVSGARRPSQTPDACNLQVVGGW